MTANFKDSHQIAEFRALFARLKDWIDNDPTSLRESARVDDGTKDLCLDVLKVAGGIQKSERSNRDLFTGPVDPKFVLEWRDFEERFASVLLGVFEDAAAVKDSGLLFSFGYYEEPQQWTQADHSALTTAQAFDATFRFAQACAERAIEKSERKPTFTPINHRAMSQEFQRILDGYNKAQIDFYNSAEELKNAIYDSSDELDKSERHELITEIERRMDELYENMPIEYVAIDAKEEWDKLKYQAGLDLRGFLRRRALIPFVLFPRHISARHNRPDVSLLYETLRQAHEAFVFGAPFAALALMRSVMETILREQDGAAGMDLKEYINSVGRHLPKRADAAALHRLRMLANKILHSKPDQITNSNSKEKSQLERDIVSLLFVLRALVEEAPPNKYPAGRA